MNIENTEMAKAWAGEAGHWTAHAERYERSGHRLWRHFRGAGLIAAGDEVLDIGCGTGKSTRDAARMAASGSALGVDLSAQMVERARQLAAAEGVTNVRFEAADVQAHPFDDASFDVAISSFGTMFFSDPVAAFANVGRALRPGGRLGMLTWRELASNEWVMVVRDSLAAGRVLPEPPTDAPGPFGLSDAGRVRGVLGAAGFVDVDLQPIDEPLELGDDGDDAFAFMRSMGVVRGLTEDLDDTTRSQALDALHRALVDRETPDGVLLRSAAWLVTARRP